MSNFGGFEVRNLTGEGPVSLGGVFGEVFEGFEG